MDTPDITSQIRFYKPGHSYKARDYNSLVRSLLRPRRVMIVIRGSAKERRNSALLGVISATYEG